MEKVYRYGNQTKHYTIKSVYVNGVKFQPKTLENLDQDSLNEFSELSSTLKPTKLSNHFDISYSTARKLYKIWLKDRTLIMS